MAVKVKSMRCKVCNLKFDDPSDEAVEYFYNACSKPANKCGLTDCKSIGSNKLHQGIYYHDKSPAWLQTGNTVHVLYDDPLSGTVKGKKIVELSTTPSVP